MPRKKRITQSSEGPFIHGSDPFKDFRNTLWYVWKELGLPPPTKRQYALAEFLQDGPKREVILGYRGIGKSWILSTWVPHKLRTNPELNFLIISGNAERAKAFSTFTLRLIQDIDIFQHLRPGADTKRTSMEAFDVMGAPPSHAPSVKSVGITGQITGSRADHIIADDIETPNNSATVVQREKLWEAVKELDAVVKPKIGRVTYLGTPQFETSLYNELSGLNGKGKGRGYTARRFPSEFPTLARLAAYRGTLDPGIEAEILADPSLAGKPTDPDRFDELELQERKLSYGRSGYALQYLLDTSLSDTERYPLKLSDLVVMDLDDDVGPSKVVWSNQLEYAYGEELPSVGMSGDRFYRPAMILGDYVPYKGSVCAVDPSGRGKDELGYCVTKNIGGQLFVPAYGGLRGGYSDENLTLLAHIFKRHKVNEVIVEENFGDGMFSKMLGAITQKIYPVTITEVKHSKQKELRIIDILEPVMNQHKLIFSKKAIEQEWDETNLDVGTENDAHLSYKLFYQLTRLTKERGALVHDDRLDALSMSVGYWLEQMGLDVDRLIAENQDEKAKMRLRAFEESLGRRQTNSSIWLPPHLSHLVGRRSRSNM